MKTTIICLAILLLVVGLIQYSILHERGSHNIDIFANSCVNGMDFDIGTHDTLDIKDVYIQGQRGISTTYYISIILSLLIGLSIGLLRRK